MEKYRIECKYHIYINLYYGDKWLFCYDNDCEYMETIIDKIEKRTKQKFADLEIKGKKEDFDGLRFLGDGFRKNWL